MGGEVRLRWNYETICWKRPDSHLPSRKIGFDGFYKSHKYSNADYIFVNKCNENGLYNVHKAHIFAITTYYIMHIMWYLLLVILDNSPCYVDQVFIY